MGWGRTLEEIWDRSAALAQFCGLINFLKTNEVDYQPQEALHNNNNFIQQHSLEMSRVEWRLNRHIENTIRRRITASPLEKKKKKNPLTARSTSRNSIQIPLICETQFRFPFLCEGISYPPNLHLFRIYILCAYGPLQRWAHSRGPFPVSEHLKGTYHNLIYVTVSSFCLFLVDYKQFEGKNYALTLYL